MTTEESNSATEVQLPALGESVTEATLTRWLKSPGDRVEREEPLFEAATDKVDTEVPSPVAGVVLSLLVAEDTLVEVGAPVALIDEGDPAVASAAKASPDSASTGSETASPPTEANADIARADPAAEESSIADSGATHDRVEKLSRIRRTIATRMMQSLQSSAQLTTVIEVDMTEIARLRSKVKQRFVDEYQTKLSFLPFIAVAAVASAAEHPIINSSVDAECTEITYHESVNLGMAVDSPKGLMVPVIKDAQAMSIPKIAQAIAEIADAVRGGTVSADQLSGGTFTITNTGSRGALFDTPILNQPQSAILGVGTIVERLVPNRDSEGNIRIDVRSMAYLSITYDHRVVDGADAARYLTSVKTILERGCEVSDVFEGAP
ncbi:hypothetical protein GCM10027289_08160 [Tsukamurella serpentis]